MSYLTNLLLRRRAGRAGLAALSAALVLPLAISGGTANAMMGDNRNWTDPTNGHGQNCRQTDNGSAGDDNDGSLYNVDLRDGSDIGMWANINDSDTDGYVTASENGESTGQLWASDRPIRYGPDLPAGADQGGYGWFAQETPTSAGYGTGMRYARQRSQWYGDRFRYGLTVTRPDTGGRMEHYYVYSQNLTEGQQFHVDNFRIQLDNMRNAQTRARNWGAGGTTAFAIGLTASAFVSPGTAIAIGACVPLVAGAIQVSHEWINYYTAWRSARASIDALIATGATDDWTLYV